MGVVAGAADHKMLWGLEIFEEGGGGVVLDPAGGGVGEGDLLFGIP